MSEENIIRLGAYGQVALDIIRATSESTLSDWPWNWKKPWFTRLSDGEAAYDTSLHLESYFRSSIPIMTEFSENEKLMFRRRLSRCIWNAFCKSRGMELLKNPCRFKNPKPEYTFTYGQCCLFVEILDGKKLKENLVKKYTPEEIETVVSSPADPLITGAVAVLIDEIESLKKEQTEEIRKLHEEISTREKALKAKYQEKLDKLQRQIEETRNGK